MSLTWNGFQTRLQKAGIINEDIAKARKAWDAEVERIAYGHSFYSHPVSAWPQGISISCRVCHEWFDLAAEAGYESPDEFPTLCGECADSEHDCYDYAFDNGAGCMICNKCWHRISGSPDI